MSSLGQDYPFYLYLEALVLFLNSPVLQPSSIRAAPELRGQSSFTVFPRATYDASLACGSCMSFYSQLWHTTTVLVCKANPCCYQKRSHPCSHLHVFFSFFICPLLLQCCAFRWVISQKWTEPEGAEQSPWLSHMHNTVWALVQGELWKQPSWCTPSCTQLWDPIRDAGTEPPSASNGLSWCTVCKGTHVIWLTFGHLL